MVPKTKFSVSAPGKIILSGEHAVVYGYPALATAIDLRLTLTASSSGERINSQLPVGGLGSSSALSVCRAAAELGLRSRPLSKHSIARRALILDRVYHEQPSGVDTTVCTYGGWVWYQQGHPVKRLRPKIKLPQLYLLNTGRPVESTAEMVKIVGVLRSRKPKQTENIFRQIAACTDQMMETLQGLTLKWSQCIRENEHLLEELGVVSDSTKKLIRLLEKSGASAKVTGAGGRSQASGAVLIYHPDTEKLLAFSQKHTISLQKITLGAPGVTLI